jgi:hypothetical protein
MTDLSPAAQAVLDAACDSLDRRGYISDEVAAALRALAVRIKGADDIRQDILDIAAELEA